MEKPIPQPPTTFFIGNLNEIDSDFFLGSLDRLRQTYGEIFRLTIFGRSIVIISSQELANFVCDETKFDKKVSEVLNQIRNVAGDGLFTAHTSEPNWKLAHRILMPAFGPQAIRDMFPAMVDIASQLILRWERFAGDEIDVCDNFTRLTLDTIALCSFNYRFNSFYQTKMHRFVDAMVNVLIEGGRRAQRLPIQKALMFGTNRRFFDDIAFLHNLCDEIVRERRAKPNEINDLLNRMINGKDPETGFQLSDENIRYQMVTFLIAGHETTSGLLSFTVYYLLKNPRCLQKAQAEVDQFEEITVDTLSKLKYVDAVLKETLRLSPTAPSIALQCKDDSVLLPGGYRVNKDEMVSLFLFGLHRDPKIWNQPEEFLPERMLNGGYEKLPPNSWKPFGNGQRACIGRPFAWQESLLTLALILKHFHMEFVDPSYDLRIKQTLTIKPDGLKIRVRSRKHFQPAVPTERKFSMKNVEQAAKPVDVTNLHPMLILFGSNSGSCESFARTLASEAMHYGYVGAVATLDSAVESLPNDRPVIVITASYEGQPCENAKQFVAYLESKPKIETKFAVFGAGHHDWVNSYQKVPIFIDRTLEQLGGQRLIERGEGDAAGDFYGAFEAWKERLFRTIDKSSATENFAAKDKLSIEIVHSNRQFGQIHEVGVVLENRLLVEASDVGSSVRHLEIRLPKGQTYRSGDYLAILPTNPMEVVSRVLRQFHLSTDTHIRIHSATETFLPTNQPISAFDLLSGYVELGQPISKKQLETLAELCENETEKKELLRISGENYAEEVLEKRLNILNVLESFRSCQLPFGDYLRMLPCLRFRQYSISSSPLWNGEVVTLTFDVLRSPALSGVGQYVGVASNYLAELKQGDRLSCSVRTSNMNFHPPDETDVPIVMIAAGTGLAPFRAFVQERAAQLICGRKVGKTRLYFGCRTENYFFYKSEFDKWTQLDGIEVRLALSRDESRPKRYVQDLLWEDRREIVELFRQGAKFYTCGSASRLGVSVKECFIKIVAEHNRCDEAKAKEIWEKISLDRYSVDVFA